MAESGGTANHGPQIELSPTPVLLTVLYAARTVMVHPVTAEELDSIASLSNSVHMTFFGVCVGGLVSFGIVLQTGSITDPMTHAAYIALLAVFALGTLYCGIRGFIDYRNAKRRLRDLKSEKR